MDGEGDLLSATVSLCQNGKSKELVLLLGKTLQDICIQRLQKDVDIK